MALAEDGVCKAVSGAISRRKGDSGWLSVKKFLAVRAVLGFYDSSFWGAFSARRREVETKLQHGGPQPLFPPKVEGMELVSVRDS